MTDQATAARFAQVVLVHVDAAYNLARWITGNDHNAEDVLQESLLRAHKFFSTFRGDDGRAWLFKIVRNTYSTWVQANQRRMTTEPFDEAQHSAARPSVDPSVGLIEAADRELVARTLAALPVEQREIVVMRELEGLSYKQIAAVTELPIGTVMSRLSRARDRLQEILAAHEKGAGREL